MKIIHISYKGYPITGEGASRLYIEGIQIGEALGRNAIPFKVSFNTQGFDYIFESEADATMAALVLPSVLIAGKIL